MRSSCSCDSMVEKRRKTSSCTTGFALLSGCKQWLLQILRDDSRESSPTRKNLTLNELYVNTPRIDGLSMGWKSAGLVQICIENDVALTKALTSIASQESQLSIRSPSRSLNDRGFSLRKLPRSHRHRPSSEATSTCYHAGSNHPEI